jgi:NADH-quinone oxidoreductase subunit L
MGGLRKYLPVTYWTTLIGAISSAGIPGFAGFFSKDSIIEAAHLSRLPGAGFAYVAVLLTVFVTALYTFRLIFMTFHGAERFRDDRGAHHDHEAHGTGDAGPHAPIPRESPAVVTVPLIFLAIPSIGAGWVIGPVLFGDYFGNAIVVAPSHDVLALMGEHFGGVVAMMIHGLLAPAFWLAVAGIVTAWFFYLKRPDLPEIIRQKAGLIYTILERKYGFDELYQYLFGDGAVLFGTGLWKGGDVAVIDGVFVNGSARLVGWFAAVVRLLQSGFIYHYAFAMIIGILVLLTMIFLV